MVNEPDFASVAALVGEPARAAMLSMLFDGRAMPAGELARAARISAATASSHLNKLLEGGLVRVRSQGRHRYYELARAEIAHTLEALGSIGPPAPVRSLSASLRMQRLRFARSCYNHLAGEVALAIAQALVRLGGIEPDEDGFRLRDRAREVLLPVGIDPQKIFRSSNVHVTACIDWTERRHHVSGPLGIALLQALLSSGAVRRRSEPRILDLTADGRELLARVFGVDLRAAETMAS